ncbi:YceI family protein [Granulosicoccus sp.]|nr:YceI family protein [Granulosicoccus sp.]MDB4224269.1 YceI family protein [Granulosicoccus sp.]
MFIRKIISTSLLVVAVLTANTATADLTLDSERSSVSLISYKVLAGAAASFGERHSFSNIAGTVGDDGKALVTVPLDTIETGIPIRNERLTKFVFETEKYPAATITADVPDTVMGTGTHMMDLDVTLSFHGKEQMLTIPVLVVSAELEVVVSATQPVMLDATAFDLGAGIGKLAELAKLLHIPTTVPVSFSLVFNR